MSDGGGCTVGTSNRSTAVLNVTTTPAGTTAIANSTSTTEAPARSDTSQRVVAFLFVALPGLVFCVYGARILKVRCDCVFVCCGIVSKWNAGSAGVTLSSETHTHTFCCSHVTACAACSALLMLCESICGLTSVLLQVTVFAAAATSAGILFYAFSPAVFDTTSFCCGKNGTELGHVAVSVGIGIVGGAIGLAVFRCGLFALGACFGLVIAVLLLATPLHEDSFFESNAGFGTFYGGCALVMGIVALVFTRAMVVLGTSAGGAYAFLLGLDYFVESGFQTQTVHAIHRVEEAIDQSFSEKRTDLSRTP